MPKMKKVTIPILNFKKEVKFKDICQKIYNDGRFIFYPGYIFYHNKKPVFISDSEMLAHIQGDEMNHVLTSHLKKSGGKGKK